MLSHLRTLWLKLPAPEQAEWTDLLESNTPPAEIRRQLHTRLKVELTADVQVHHFRAWVAQRDALHDHHEDLLVEEDETHRQNIANDHMNAALLRQMKIHAVTRNNYKLGLRIFRLALRIEKLQLWVDKHGRILRLATESISDAFWTKVGQSRRLKADYMEFMKVVEPEWYAQQPPPPPPEPPREPWVEPTEEDYANAAGLTVEELAKMRVLWAEKAAREDAERARRGY
jgi:hypothetical protein